jgi:hypothetical protein
MRFNIINFPRFLSYSFVILHITEWQTQISSRNSVKNSVFWDMTTCSPSKGSWRLRGTFRFHLHGWKYAKEETIKEADMFLR